MRGVLGHQRFRDRGVSVVRRRAAAFGAVPLSRIITASPGGVSGEIANLRRRARLGSGCEGDTLSQFDARQPGGPRGGLQLQAKTVRRWRWSPTGELLSAPVRCKREQWYLARGFPADGVSPGCVDLQLTFVCNGVPVAQRSVQLEALAGAEPGEALLGWLQAPEGATHLQVCLPEPPGVSCFEQLVLHPVAERDPKCSPLANVPRWGAYRPSFPIRRVMLPTALQALAEHLVGLDVDLLGAPRSLRKLSDGAAGAACVIDPGWVQALGLDLSDLERLAARAWVLVDLETFSTLANRGGAARTKLATYTSEHEIMSARVEYADVPTRGFALQDVFPYGTLAGATAFRTRVLLANAAWKRYADQTGFATLLASETPWEKKCGDVLSAARPIGRGELIVSDLPWLVAGRHGRLLAPHLAAHALRMHLGGPLADDLQYWNRWDDGRVVVRDLGDMPRHYPPLRAVRWAAQQRGVAKLGITLPAGDPGADGRHLMLCTGRIDQLSSHDGVPPEPVAIFMKWLAREARERTRWATRHLLATTVTWQFDTADGAKYVLHFGTAAGTAADQPARTLMLKTDLGRRATRKVSSTRGAAVVTLPAGAGVFGDRCLDYQARLSRQLRRWIEQVGADGHSGR
jgi:hypothetical protein